ncbi:MAG: hypothetical protein PVF33_13610 [Candidatus Latescibacterota bacterium]|jgi:hypothetical protein
MKAFLIALVMAMCFEAAAAQQGGQLELWADPLRSSCEIVESPSGITEVHMIHAGSITAASMERFTVPIPPCWIGATWVADELAPGLIVGMGNTQDPLFGMVISYAGCLDLPVYLGKILVATTGQSEPCCDLVAEPAREYPHTYTLECATPVVVWTVEYRGAIVNATSECPCEGAVPVERSTWGLIKALYKDTP